MKNLVSNGILELEKEIFEFEMYEQSFAGKSRFSIKMLRILTGEKLLFEQYGPEWHCDKARLANSVGINPDVLNKMIFDWSWKEELIIKNYSLN